MRFVISQHAATRFNERLRPGLDYSAAYRELDHLVREFAHIGPAPAWYARRHAEANDATHYATIGEDVCLPLDDRGSGVFVIVTVVPRGTMTTGVRKGRNKQRRAATQTMRQFRRDRAQSERRS